MADVNILVALGLPEKLVERIRAVDSRLKVAIVPWRQLSEEGGSREALAQAEVILTWSVLAPDLLARAPSLRWIQLISAGVDRLLGSELLKSGITVTTASGIHATPIGEYVLGMMIMLAKGWPRLFRSQAKREWARFVPQELHDQTVG